MTTTSPITFVITTAIPLIFMISIIQYPYYLYERADYSISIYQYGPWGYLYPIADFPNLQALVYRLGASGGVW